MTLPLMDPHGTHLPLLVAAVARTTGDVLELGCGNYSTLVLHELCKALNRRLWTYDSDPAWLDQFMHLASDGHQLFPVDKDHWDSAAIHRPWGCAFVDHAGPDSGRGERRIVEIGRLAKWADAIVVHDTEEAGYGYEPTLARFTYRMDYKIVRPWTSVVSNRMDVGAWK